MLQLQQALKAICPPAGAPMEPLALIVSECCWYCPSPPQHSLMCHCCHWEVGLGILELEFLYIPTPGPSGQLLLGFHSRAVTLWFSSPGFPAPHHNLSHRSQFFLSWAGNGQQEFHQNSEHFHNGAEGLELGIVGANRAFFMSQNHLGWETSPGSSSPTFDHLCQFGPQQVSYF